MSKIIAIGHNKAVKKMRQNKSFSRFDDKKIKQNDHLDQIQVLQHNIEAATRLAIDNLVLTYGIETIRKAVDSIDLKLIKKSKKVA